MSGNCRASLISFFVSANDRIPTDDPKVSIVSVFGFHLAANREPVGPTLSFLIFIVLVVVQSFGFFTSAFRLVFILFLLGLFRDGLFASGYILVYILFPVKG